MSRLNLRFLGTPEVWREQQLLRFPTRKSLALLIYLAVSGEWHSREKLITLLWPESDARRGQASLRNALARMRQALGKADSHLLLEADRLSFDLSTGVTLDWQHLTALSESQDAAALQQAVELYRGDFLEGFSLPDASDFDTWASLQRERWRRLLSDLLARLTRIQTDAAQLKEGLATALRWTAHDPFNESAHRSLIELQALAGDKNAALQAYETVRTILATELAVEPSPETEALVEQIKAERQRSRGTEALARPLSGFLVPSLPFVGRSIKHVQLVTAFHAARQGQTQIAIIEGEAGIGKTRLATEFLSWATTHRADVLPGRALEAGGRLPYQPVVDALRPRIEQENAPDDLLSDIWLAELSRLLPELHDRYPDLPSPVDDPSLAPTRLSEATTRLGQALARRRPPLVIFIDDAQWADVASLDLLHYCVRAWVQAATPILLLLTLRPETGSATTPLHEWLTNLGRNLPIQRLGLESLSQADTRQLAQNLVNRVDVAGRASADRFGDWLFAQTRGQPFFISETVKDLLGRGALKIQPGPKSIWTMDIAALDRWLATGPSVTPGNVHHLITARLNRLTPTASALLTAAAVIGRSCGDARLSQVADLDEAMGLSALDELLNAHLLIEHDNANRPYTIAHDKIREVIYDEAGAARRRIFHRRAFEALEKDAIAHPEPGRKAAELAYHALGAHLTGPTFRYSLTAGDNALTLFAVREAIAAYEQARTLLTHYQYPKGTSLPISDLQSFDFVQDRSQISNLYLNLGRAYELAGDLKQAETIYQELLQLAQISKQMELTCSALNRLATVTVHIYNFERAVDYLQQAIQVATDSHNTAGLAEAEWGQAQLYHHRFDFQRSLVHSERTLKLARQLGDEALVAGSLNALAYAQMLLGHVGEGEARMTEARAGYGALGNKAMEADCLTAIAATQIWQGHIQDGIETARAAKAISAKIENPWGYIYSRVWLATGLLDSGDYEAALAVARAGQTQARSHNLPPMSMFIALVLGKIYLALGQWAAAYETHQEALAINEQVKSDIHAALIEAELCADCVLSGNWTEATTHARRALAYRKYDVLPLVISSHWLETEALLQAGDIKLAREDIQRWGEVIGAAPRFQVGHLQSLAALAKWDKDIEQAIALLEEANTLTEEIDLPGEQWPILAKLGALYRAIEDKHKSQQAFARSAEIIQGLVANIDDEALRADFVVACGIIATNEDKV